MSTSQQTLLKYCHTDPTITTLSDLVNKTNSLFAKYKGKEQELENIKGPDGKTNRQNIEASYNNPDKDNPTEKWPLLKVNTVLYLRPDEAERDFLSFESQGQVLEFSSWGKYRNEVQELLDKLKAEGKYVPSYSIQSKNYSLEASVRYVIPLFRIWVYCKALNEIFDVTNFCYKVETSTDVSGGDSFSFAVSYLTEDAEKIKSRDYSLQEDVYISGSYKTLSYFMKYFSENDIVFISFEELKAESDRGLSMSVVSKSLLGQQYYDFLGLITNVQQNSLSDGTGIVIVNGTSFEKVFQDDEAIFKPIAAIGDSFAGNVILGDRQKRGWMQRMFSDGQYHSLFTVQFRTIERTMKFFLNLVSNVGFLPLDDLGKENTELFSSYAYVDDTGKFVDDRTYLYEMKVTKDDIQEVQTTLAKGIYQIIKLSVDPQLSKRYLSDSTVSNPQGSILSLFQSCCAPYLTEILMDTYKNTFNIICRIPPFSKKSIEDWLSGELYEITEDMVSEESLTWETKFYTWFEIQPKGNIVPVDSMEALCYVPILFLSDFIDVWGSRRLSVVSPYTVIPEGTVGGEIEQTIQDLCWLVQSNFYLPFTRRGTVVLKVPDRRLKKGTWIKYSKTGEIFYVEGVTQTVSVSSSMVERQTVLNLSRGLVEKYVKDEQGYFSMIDFEALKESLSSFSKQNKTSISVSPVINKSIFKFFCERKQFDEV